MSNKLTSLACILLRVNLNQPIKWSKMLFLMLFIQFLNKKKKFLMMRQHQMNFN
jgi:hypothetical protein